MRSVTRGYTGEINRQREHKRQPSRGVDIWSSEEEDELLFPLPVSLNSESTLWSCSLMPSMGASCLGLGLG
jgi:hypothetical protein